MCYNIIIIIAAEKPNLELYCLLKTLLRFGINEGFISRNFSLVEVKDDLRFNKYLVDLNVYIQTWFYCSNALSLQKNKVIIFIMWLKVYLNLQNLGLWENRLTRKGWYISRSGGVRPYLGTVPAFSRVRNETIQSQSHLRMVGLGWNLSPPEWEVQFYQITLEALL